MQTQPATNLELQKWIARQFGIEVDSTWIEQSRRLLDARGPENSSLDPADETKSPAEMRIAIKQALRHFGMLS